MLVGFDWIKDEVEENGVMATAVKCLLVLVFAVFFLWALCFRFAATDETGAMRTLLGAGYREIHFIYDGQWKCDYRSDWVSTRFEAVGPTGVKVTGSVCSSAYKGNTIRLD